MTDRPIRAIIVDDEELARLRANGINGPEDDPSVLVEPAALGAPRLFFTRVPEAILHMGFSPTVRIVKTRRTARLGELALCLDEVEHLGLFLDVERVIPPGRFGEDIQTQLDAFARSLGVELERTTDTYDSLLRAAEADAY